MSDQWFTDADVEAVLDDCLSLQFGKHDNEPVEVGMEAVIRHVLATVVPAKVAELQTENERLHEVERKCLTLMTERPQLIHALHQYADEGEAQRQRADKAEAHLAAVAALADEWYPNPGPARLNSWGQLAREKCARDLRAALADPAVGDAGDCSNVECSHSHGFKDGRCALSGRPDPAVGVDTTQGEATS